MDKQSWNKLVIENLPPFGGFLQSYEWGEFQQSIGREVTRFLYSENNETIIAQSIRHNLPFGQQYEYIPKGPLGNYSTNTYLKILRENYQNAIFLRLEPSSPDSLAKVKEVQPAVTTIVDLTKTEEDILGSMKSKTRYNVRLSSKKGVTYKIHDNLSALEDFWRLMKQTSVRDHFRSHPKTYYEALLKSIGSAGDMKAFIATAHYEDRILSANILIDFANTRTYLHGATSNLHRNVMAQYGLHFYLMQDAKKQGLQKFDFWGIAPPDANKKHPWFGITRYKLGYGGDIIKMPGTYDFVRKHIYYGVYSSARKIRRFL